MGQILVTDEEGVTQELSASEGSSLMAVLRDHDYDIPAICGGACSCGTCHVLVGEKWIDKIPEMEMEEEFLLETLNHYDEARSRLACQVKFTEQLDGLSLQLLEQN